MPSKVLVVFKEGTPQEVVDAAALNANGGEVQQRYNGTVMYGFLGLVPEGYMSVFEDHPGVDYTQPEEEVFVPIR